MTDRAMIVLLAAKLLVFAGLLVGALVRHDVFFYVMTVLSALTILTTTIRTNQSTPAPTSEKAEL